MARWRKVPLGWIGVATAILLVWHVALFTGISGDVFWQWAAGRWMLLHHEVVRADPFSYTVHGRSWFDQEWGYEVLLAWSIGVFGRGALWVFSAGLASCAVLAVAGLARSRGAGWTWVGLLTLVTGLGLLVFLRDRPQEISYVFFPLLMWLLTTARKAPRRLLVIPPLVLVWANLHGSFLLGLLVLGLEVLWAWVPVKWGRIATETLRRRDALGTFATSSLLALVNPHGFGLLNYTWQSTFNPSITGLIAEWQSPDFHVLILLLLVALPLAVTLIWLAVADTTVNWSDVVLTGGLLVATLHAVRFLPYWLEAWAALAAGFRPWSDWSRKIPWLVGLLAVALLGAVTLGGRPVPPGTPTAEPVLAVRYLNRHPGRIFTRYRWGDYLIFRGIPVFIDGRTNLYAGTGILREYLALRNLTRDPDTILARYQVDYVLWTPDTPLSVFLAHDRRWQLVWRSRTAEIFRHRGSWIAAEANPAGGVGGGS
jgi:hypothetical protein